MAHSADWEHKGKTPVEIFDSLEDDEEIPDDLLEEILEAIEVFEEDEET